MAADKLVIISSLMMMMMTSNRQRRESSAGGTFTAHDGSDHHEQLACAIKIILHLKRDNLEFIEESPLINY
jgi:hypothetical protein